jgi:hypothetical protein
MNLSLPGANNAGSTSAPFAEKKIAKDAAPENSIRDLVEFRCDAKGFATRPLSNTQRVTEDISVFEIRKSGLNQPQHDRKDHRCRNPEQEHSICRFKWTQQSPSRRHDEITVT